jgi:hypothetical protein
VIKITLKYHLIPVRITIKKKTKDLEYRGPLFTHWECKLLEALGKTDNPVIPLLGTYSKRQTEKEREREREIHTLKRCLHSYFYCSIMES